MDTLLTSSTSTAIADAEPTMIRRRTIQWPGGPAIKQRFSLPESIIYYIAMNPSTPEVYNKLIQTCKYFFEVNPILVVATMTGNVICSKVFFNGEFYEINDIKKTTSKIWITRRLRIDQKTIPNFAALLRPKIYRCDIFELRIIGGTVEFEDFKFFALSAESIALESTQVVCHEGNPVMLENVLEALSNVEYFNCSFENNASMVSASTVKNMSKLKNLEKLNTLFFSDIPELFKVDDLFAFIKDHPDINVWLYFAHDISEQYKNELDQLIDSVIEAKLPNCYIRYPGQNGEKCGMVSRLFFY